MNALAETIAHGPAALSTVLTVAGTLLALSPLCAAYALAGRLQPAWRWTWMGITLGLIALPLSLWMCFQYYTDSIRATVLGIPGFVLFTWHTQPFGKSAMPFLLNVGDIASGRWRVPMLEQLAICGLLWAAAYGIIGGAIDLLRHRKNG